MKNKKIFDLSLCMEGVRQLRVFGLVTLILYIVVAFLKPYNSNALSYYHNNWIYDPITYVPYIYMLFMVVAPCFTLYLFSFLLKRSSSDFFHSLPHKKICLFNSFFTSIVIWIFSIEFVTVVSNMLFSKIFDHGLVFKAGDIIMPCIGIFIASITVCAGVLIAVSITGNLLSNIVVSGLILIAPKLFVEFSLSKVEDLTNYVFDKGSFMPVLTGRYNLVTSFMSEIDVENMHNVIYQLYTFILFVIMYAIALFLFNKRKSEVAGNAASNHILQSVYRIFFTMVLCLIPMGMLVDGGDETYIISWYVVIVIFYFIYEIVTTKSVRKLYKIVPGIVVVVFLNIILVNGIRMTVDNILEYKPEVKNISAVYLEEYGLNGWKKDYFDSYSMKVADYDFRVEDEDGIKTVSKALDETIKHKDRYWAENSYSFRVCFEEKSGEKYYRNIEIKSSDVKDIIKNAIVDNKEYLADLPDADSVKHLDYTWDYGLVIDNKLSNDDLIDIYKAYRVDYAKMTDYEKVAFRYGFEDEPSSSVCNINLLLQTEENDEYINISVDEKMENSYKALLDIIREKEVVNLKEDVESFKDLVIQNEDVYVWTAKGNYIKVDKDLTNYGFSSAEDEKMFFEYMDELSEYAITDAEKYMRASYGQQSINFKLSGFLKVGDKEYEYIRLYFDKNDKTSELAEKIESLMDAAH